MAITTISRPTLTDDTGDGISGDILNAAFFGTNVYDKIDAILSGASLVIGGTFRTNNTTDTTAYSQTDKNLLSGAGNAECLGLAGAAAGTSLNWYLGTVAARKVTMQVVVGGALGGQLVFLIKPDSASDVAEFFRLAHNGEATLTHASANMKVTTGTITTTLQPGFIGTSSAHDLVVLVGNSTKMKLFTTGGVIIGAAADQGAGTLNVTGGVYKNGTAFTNPKWALQHYFTGAVDAAGPYAAPAWYPGLRSLDAHRADVAARHDLPLMLENPGGDIFDRGDLLLASLEEAYLYIYQLHDRLSALEQGRAA
jgi:hypothetical protein